MEVHYCYRCRRDVPLLDETEFAYFSGLLDECTVSLGASVTQEGTLPPAAVVEEFFRPFLEEYERRTGFRETNPKAFLHHRRSDFGAPCRGCGRLLRTPKASRCMECGTPKPTAVAPDRGGIT